MAEENFYRAVEIAKRIEREMLSYTPFEGKIDVIRTLDFYPKEYVNFNFNNLLNYYDRIDKVIKASKLDVYSAGSGTMAAAAGRELPPKEIIGPKEKPQEAVKKEEKVRAKAKAKTEEVESKVKEITASSIESAESVKSAETIEKIEEKMKVKAEEEKPIESKKIDFGVLEFEKPDISIKREEKPEEKKERELETKRMILVEEKGIDKSKAPIPSALEVSAKEAASAKYQEIEEHLRREWEGEINEQKIKKKMLDLTKELFKEKSVHARDRIKGEIVALKSMLSKMITKKKRGAEVVVKYSPALFESLVATQSFELTAAKESLVSTTRKDLETIKKKFYDKLVDIGEDGSREERKAIYEQFVFELTALSERLGGDIDRQQSFIGQKHVSETEKFIESLPKEEKKLAEKAQERMDSLKQLYQKEFASTRNILGKEIETLIDQAGHTVFKEEEEKTKTETLSKKEMDKEQISRILFDINETDEATLLYYLHSKNSELYKKYERKHLSKHEAVHHAKIIMAKEKGLSDDIITKYFGQFERAEEEK